ncbi:MAG: 4-diphosphocytidyl-2C-methyl-D-erythritol kinase [Firmicutes bacterium]|nr:4-diphosphocytidyl-2C-methyl-D-erythritol kinase [Bacillota bacterium]
MPCYQAPAKINLGLRVGPRDTRGFHPIDTVMQTVAMKDWLTLEPHDHLTWSTTGDPVAVTMDDNNLVVRAYHWCRGLKPQLPPVNGHLHKVIWTGAGLGGGSSDAAAVIRWAFEGDAVLTSPEFHQRASVLGMDVPFFLVGGTVRAEGYGEHLTPIFGIPQRAVVLANPGFSLSTAAVYAAFDADDGVKPLPPIEDTLECLRSGEAVPREMLANDLEDAAFRVEPALRSFRDVIQSAADGAPFALSGSGPTYYILGSDDEWAGWMARRLHARGIPRVYPTTTLDRGSQ